jgi:hypothetical protein
MIKNDMNTQNSQPTQIESEDPDLPPAGKKKTALLKTLIRFWGRNKVVLSLIYPKTIYLLN